ALDAVREFAERRGDQHLALFLECAHAAAIGLRGAAKQDHWPAILLGIGEAGEPVHHAGAGHNDAGAGAAGQIAVGLRRVGGGLLVAHADIGNAFLLCGYGDRGDRKPNDPEQVIDALLLEAPRYQGRAVDFAHAFLLVLQAQDYALMARLRKGFADSATPHRPRRCPCTQPPSPYARVRAKRFDEIASPHCLPQPRDSAIFGFQLSCQNRKLRPALRCRVLEPSAGRPAIFTYLTVCGRKRIARWLTGAMSAQQAATAAQKIATRGEHALERKRTWRPRSERGDPT